MLHVLYVYRMWQKRFWEISAEIPIQKLHNRSHFCSSYFCQLSFIHIHKVLSQKLISHSKKILISHSKGTKQFQNLPNIHI